MKLLVVDNWRHLGLKGSTSTLDSVYMHALSGLDRWKSCIKGVSQFPSETTKLCVCMCVKNTLMVAASTVFTVVVVVVRD